MTVDMEMNRMDEEPLHPRPETPSTDTANFHGNFMTENFKIGPTPSTLGITEQLARDPKELTLRSHSYGVLKSEDVGDNFYVRPRYLRFGLHTGVMTQLKKLLVDKWKLKSAPPLFLHVYGDTDFSEPVLTKLVLLADEVGAWFMCSNETHQGIGYQARLLRQRRALSEHNSVYWRSWGDLSAEEQTQLSRLKFKAHSTAVKESRWEVTEDYDKKMSAQQNSCFLFPDTPPADTSFPHPALRDIALITKELAEEFGKGGRGLLVANDVGIHVCRNLNICIYKDANDVAQNEQQMSLLNTLVESESPTMIIFKTDVTDEHKEKLKKFRNSENVTVCSVNDDLATCIQELLIKSRQSGLPNDYERARFKNDLYTKLYASLIFGDEDQSKEILRNNVNYTQLGIKENVTSLLFLLKKYSLLEWCINEGYEISTCLYGNVVDGKLLSTLTLRSNNHFTKHFSEDLGKVRKVDEKAAVLLKFINQFMDGTTFFTNPNAELEWILYLYFCINEEWDFVRLIRKYSEFPMFKCLLTIQVLNKIRDAGNNASNSDYFDIQKIEDEISALNMEVRDMTIISDKKALDTSHILFFEHHLFADQSILSLAEDTHSLGIYENKTNVSGCITRRWNGGLDPATSWISIILSWFTLGLLAPTFLTFVPKRGMWDEINLFLNERGRERTYCEKWRSFWRSPRSKCYLLMITYLVFLYILTVIVLDNTRPNEPVTISRSYIWIALLFVISFFFVELNFDQVDLQNCRIKLNWYFSSTYNRLDLCSAGLFVLYFLLVLAYDGDTTIFFVSKLAISLSYIGYIVRFTQFLQMFEQLGPKLITIRNMLADLAFFACFLLLTIFSYGIVSEFLLHPDSRSVNTRLIIEILKRPYVNMFGELDLDTLETNIKRGVCKYESKYNTTLAEVANCDSDDLEGYICGSLCVNFMLIARVLLGMYTMATVILLTNLLVSIFSKTYEADYAETRQLWQIQRFRLVREFEAQCILPFPPFNLLYSIYKIILRLTCGIIKGSKNRFYVQYVKEMEFKCSKMYHTNLIKSQESTVLSDLVSKHLSEMGYTNQ